MAVLVNNAGTLGDVTHTCQAYTATDEVASYVNLNATSPILLTCVSSCSIPKACTGSPLGGETVLPS